MKNQLGARLAPLRNFFKSKKQNGHRIMKNSIFTYIFTYNVHRGTILVSKSRFLGSRNLFII